MQLLISEKEFREWYIKDFLQAVDFEHICDDVEQFFIDERGSVSHSYPCIACVVHSENIYEQGRPYFAYRQQVLQWAELMKDLV